MKVLPVLIISRWEDMRELISKLFNQGQEDSVQPQDPWLNWIALATCVANCANVR